MVSWRYRCGFCGTYFQTELERNQHEIAAERNGGCFKPPRGEQVRGTK